MNISDVQGGLANMKKRMEDKGCDNVNVRATIRDGDESWPFSISWNYLDYDDETQYGAIYNVENLQDGLMKANNEILAMDNQADLQWKADIRKLEDLRDRLDIGGQEAVAALVDSIIAPIRTNLIEGPKDEEG